MKCPRSIEGPFKYDSDASWRSDGTCSYCGSMSPDTLFAAIEVGCELGPTDKNYKVYARLPNPMVGQHVQVGSESGPGYHNRPIMGTASATTQAKFYFQHFSPEECHRFIELMNAKKINIGVPGHFYVKPFFMRTLSDEEALRARAADVRREN